MSDLVIDETQTTILIHTFAEGLFARLAHDLELVCRGVRGTATRDGSTAKADLEVPLGSIVVAGVRDKSGNVDPNVLSASDQRDVLDKMQKDVFHAPSGGVVRVSATLDGSRVKLRVTPPSGRVVEVGLDARVEEARVKGAFEISLSSIGSDPIKGPMGAFRVKDRVAVVFDVAFRSGGLGVRPPT